ncbi:uncharacterized protein LOC113749901 [Coffea eugenioides]|uniref:uncharacterized protein LOC113749901 n=1 Tax=Coffea eugenioides TaxID=49369 RepID=UPI000F60A9E0|nr:uncharacterized protein LOC113749901 [Coffea eugenioides]
MKPSLLLVVACCLAAQLFDAANAASAVGDPGMRRDELRVAFEAWNFCNEVGNEEAPGMGSPRAADCFHISSNGSLIHKVTEVDNKLGVGKPFPGLPEKALSDPNLYAVEKELYLGSLCEVADHTTPTKPWQFWMIMLKNGNYDTRSGLCPKNGEKVPPFISGQFPCFGKGCMNQPLLYHQPTAVVTSENGIKTMKGGFSGTYDLVPFPPPFGIGTLGDSSLNSYFEVVWEKKVGDGGSWIFRHKLRTTKFYPWLMLYLRADATKGFSGGYHYDTRGMLKILPESPNFKVKLTFDIKQGGGPKSQFYLMDIGSCWKNDGRPCDGDVLTDVTRYSEMIINPETQAWCSPASMNRCPPYHITPNNIKILRNDTAHFPYSAYHYYCAPGNARFLEFPDSTCDPYSNPQAQELVQLLPHPVWAEYGYPSKRGEGWVGDGRTWELNVGALSSRLYFYQDPGTRPARRIWTSLDVGTEIFVSNKEEVAEWTLSDFDVILTSQPPSSA